MINADGMAVDYRSPECTVVDLTLEGVLCGSIGMTTEDMGSLEDIMGGEQ